MKKIIQVFIFVLLTTLAHAQLNGEGPKAYFGCPGLNSMTKEDFLKYDTLKLDNPKI